MAESKDQEIEKKLWQAADKLRSNMDAAEYKHVVLGLIFLKYISDSFEEAYKEIQKDPTGDPEDIDEYKAKNVFWVPPNSRWNYLQKNAKQPTIGKIVDEAMDSIERENSSLRGVLPKDYAREALDKTRLGELIDLIGTIGLGDRESRSKDLLGSVYEYFIGMFADEEGKKGGQFYTPKSIVKLLNDDIKIRFKKNVVQEKSFIEMLEKTITRYINKTIEAAQAIEELIGIAKKIREEQEKGKELGLKDYEKAFYDALADCKEAIDVLGDEKLRIIALEVVNMIRGSVKIDWTVRESVQAELRLRVKKILKKYGYPPVGQEHATELVLTQAKKIAEDWADQ